MACWRSSRRSTTLRRRHDPWIRSDPTNEGARLVPCLLVIDDRDQTVEMVQRQLPQCDTITRCDRRIPCSVCEERDCACPLKCAHDWQEAADALGRLSALPDLVV